MPNYLLPLLLHTDPHTLAAGGALTQWVEGREATLGYPSKRLSFERGSSPNDCELLGVLHALDHSGDGLRLPMSFVDTLDLSPKMHWWAMSMMQCDVHLN